MLNSGINTFVVWIAMVMPMISVINPRPANTVWRVFSGRRLPNRAPKEPPTITAATLIRVPVIGNMTTR